MTDQEYKELPVYHKKEFYGYLKCDPEDYELLSKYSIWLKEGYPCIKYKNKMTRVHRLVMGEPKGMIVDHIFHDTMDARKSQLRIVTRVENNSNLKGARKDSSSGVRNIRQVGENRWRGLIRHNGKYISCGTFNNLEDAKQAVANKQAEVGHLYRGCKPEIKPIKTKPNRNGTPSGSGENIYFHKKTKTYSPRVRYNGKRYSGKYYKNKDDAKVELKEMYKKLGIE